MREIAVPEEWRHLVLVVTDVTDEDRTRWLSHDELERASTFRLERRRSEWSAARIAARLLAERTGVTSDGRDLRIGVREQCPWAECARGELSLSFTHSGLAGAAALDEHPIGIDLERPRRVEPGSARFFLNDDEMRLMDLPVEDVAVHLWSAKEAAFKAAPEAHLLRRVRFAEIGSLEGGLSGRWSDGRHEGRVETRRIGDGFILSLARSV